jgi:hypothetical protein
MKKKSKSTNKKVKEWIESYKQKNLALRTKRTYVNSAKTIKEKQEIGVSKRQEVKSGIHRKMKI